MSGRAGRLGHHKDGRVLLLPKNNAELKHAKRLVSPENDSVDSQLVTLSVRRTVLFLVAARAVSSKAELTTFFQNTFYWHQILENNPKLLDVIVAKANKAIDWQKARQIDTLGRGGEWSAPYEISKKSGLGFNNASTSSTVTLFRSASSLTMRDIACNRPRQPSPNKN